MKATEALKDERFRKYLDMQAKGFIDEALSKASKEKPKPLTEFPLSYENKELNSAVNRMRLGGELFAQAFDLYLERTQGEDN